MLKNMKHPTFKMSFDEIFGSQDGEDTVDAYFCEYQYEGEQLFSTFDYGASKNVIFLNACHKNKMIQKLAEKICLKVPMRWDEYGDEFTGADSCVYKLNRHRDKDEEYYNVCEWDYCNAEAEIYRYADRRNCSEPLAETFYICDVEGHPVYGAELMDTEATDCWSYTHSHRGSEIISSISTYDTLVDAAEDYDFDTSDLKFHLATFYPLDMVMRLLQVCKDGRIQDIYPERNCGTDSKGRLKILDYSDYNN